MDLARTKSGKTIHLLGCVRNTNPRVWYWAQDKTVDEIRAAAKTFGVRACHYCRPLD